MLYILYSLSGYFMSRLQANIIGTLQIYSLPKIQIFAVSKYPFTSSVFLTFIYSTKCGRSSINSGLTVLSQVQVFTVSKNPL